MQLSPCADLRFDPHKTQASFFLFSRADFRPLRGGRIFAMP